MPRIMSRGDAVRVTFDATYESPYHADGIGYCTKVSDAQGHEYAVPSESVTRADDMRIRLPHRCLDRLDRAISTMDAEDAKPHRERNFRNYARGYAVVATFADLLNVFDPDDVEGVRSALAKAVVEGVEVPA